MADEATIAHARAVTITVSCARRFIAVHRNRAKTSGPTFAAATARAFETAWPRGYHLADLRLRIIWTTSQCWRVVPVTIKAVPCGSTCKPPLSAPQDSWTNVATVFSFSASDIRMGSLQGRNCQVLLLMCAKISETSYRQETGMVTASMPAVTATPAAARRSAPIVTRRARRFIELQGNRAAGNLPAGSPQRLGLLRFHLGRRME